jgi:hypothetical protein
MQLHDRGLIVKFWPKVGIFFEDINTASWPVRFEVGAGSHVLEI